MSQKEPNNNRLYIIWLLACAYLFYVVFGLGKDLYNGNASSTAFTITAMVGFTLFAAFIGIRAARGLWKNYKSGNNEDEQAENIDVQDEEDGENAE